MHQLKSRRAGTLYRSNVPYGVTIVELLIVVAILGIVLGIGVINGRRIADNQSEAAAVRSLQQMVWQGATAAAARGRVVTMRLEDRELVLRVGDAATGQVLRRDELPSGVSTNMPQGNVLTFTPPGKIESLEGRQEFYLEGSQGRSNIEFSIIGEVRIR